MHNFDNNQRSTHNKSVKPYCFPDMPVGHAVKNNPNIGISAFQRIDFDESGRLRQRTSTSKNEVFEDIKTKAKELEEEAYTEGFEKGERDGLLLVEESLKPVLKSLSESLVELEKAKKELLLSTEREAVELAIAISEKVVAHEISINKKVVVNVVKEALKKVVDRKRVIIKLAPADFQFLNDAKSEISGLEEDFEAVIFEEDNSVMTGGCIIETNLGEIDARIEEQLQAVEEAFRSEINLPRLRD